MNSPESTQPPAETKTCPACGALSESWSKVCPHCEFEWLPEVPAGAGRVWNPMACLWWSVLFGPLFGAVLIDRNWRNLGQNERGKWARVFLWACASFSFLALVTAFCNLGPGADKALASLVRLLGIVFIGICGSLARTQRDYLAQVEPSSWRKRAWAKPLGIAFACWLPLVSILVLAAAQNPLLCWAVEREARPLLAREFRARREFQGLQVEKVRFDQHIDKDYSGILEVRTAKGTTSMPLDAHLEDGRLLVKWPSDILERVK